MADHLFTDREMGALMRRAAELQVEDQGAHSLAEIQEIAAEVDIDPAVIAMLAARLVPDTATP